MPFSADLIYYLAHFSELRAIAEWKFWHGPIYERDEEHESQDLKECWRFLGLTSRSFVAVIQQLHPELLVPICIFYLVLRGLDTIEDDMTIRIDTKERLLRHFHEHLHDETWTFNDSGPDESDRELLVRFDCVAREYNKLRDEYRVIIKDIARRMGNGMADYAVSADVTGVKTVKDYELYCHYVAGLVGEGVTRMFVLADLADVSVLKSPELAESMAQLLQQTNVIRDIHEDHEQNRHFWPEDVWAKYVDDFGDLFLPQNLEWALQCSSEMVLLALSRADECLLYIVGVQEQSVFNFVAIPQSMAMATLALCFRNPAIFQRNVKISKGLACQLLIASTQDIRAVCDTFRTCAKEIRGKNRVEDANYHGINAACDKIIRAADAVSPTYHRPWTDRKVPLKSRTKPLSILYLGLGIAAALGVATAFMAPVTRPSFH